MREAVFSPVAVARTPYSDRKDCPKQATENAADAEIVVDPAFARAAADLAPGMEVWLLTWLDRADTSCQAVHPRGDPKNPLTGVFATRSPDRPTPIGMHRCRILGVDLASEAPRLSVSGLEVLDETPVLDIKPVTRGDERPVTSLEEEIVRVGRLGWEKGLFSGREGNISALLPDGGLLVTASGVCKGRLTPGQICRVDSTGTARPGEKPTSELPAHLAIYREQPQARAIVHTHPPHLLALEQRLPETRELLDLTLYESAVVRECFTTVPALPPGGAKLGEVVGRTARNKRALLLRRHGLICWAESLEEALCLSEEVENLARIRLLRGDSET